MNKRFFLFTLISCWCMGIGLRFVLMAENDVYTFSWFDKLFDWGILFFLGLILFAFTIHSVINENKNVD